MVAALALGVAVARKVRGDQLVIAGELADHRLPAGGAVGDPVNQQYALAVAGPPVGDAAAVKCLDAGVDLRTAPVAGALGFGRRGGSHRFLPASGRELSVGSLLGWTSSSFCKPKSN